MRSLTSLWTSAAGACASVACQRFIPNQLLVAIVENWVASLMYQPATSTTGSAAARMALRQWARPATARAAVAATSQGHWKVASRRTTAANAVADRTAHRVERVRAKRARQ